jgi:hypothetical protein
MTKKDYEAFARMFRSYMSYPTAETGVYTCPEVLDICKLTANLFGQDNARFDRERYLRACGVRPGDL